MAFITAPDFPIKAIAWTLDRPGQANVSAWAGTRVVVSNPWHGKWSAHVELATKQDESTFRTLRSFFVRCRGTLNTFRLYATAGQQNSNTGVTLSASAAAGATSISITGYTTPLTDGQFFTLNGQLCCLTMDQSGSLLAFEPPLRVAATSGTVVVTSRPYALVYLSDSKFMWQIASWRQFGLSFDVDEAILEADGAAPESAPPSLLVDLALSGALTHGTASSGTLVGATAAGTITLGGTPPAGLTIDGSAHTYTWDGSGSGTGSFTLTETWAVAANSPHTTTINYSIGAGAGSSGPSAPVLTQTSTAGTSPFTWDEALDVTGTAGLRRRLQVASDSGFATLLYDLYKPVLESEFNGNDTIWGSGTDNPPRDYTSDVITYLANLGGSIYVRERLERDDGVNSAWSNVLHDTITTVTGWKIVSHATSSGTGKGFAVAECEFQDLSGNPLTSGGTAFGADAGSTYVQASNAFDGSLTTYFLAPDTDPCELGLTWSSNKDARKVKLTGAANDGVFDKRTAMPTNFDVYKQTGGSWVFVANFTDTGSTVDNQVRTYTW